MMKHLFLIIAILCYLNLRASNEPAIIPYPNDIQFPVDSSLNVGNLKSVAINNPDLKLLAEQLVDILENKYGKKLPVNINGEGDVVLIVDNELEGEEHYKLEIGSEGILLKGSTPTAVFRGITTLEQIILDNNFNGKKDEIKYLKIEDEPRFGYRALMLDPARHFLSVSDIKRFIDLMSKYKYNILQLHLTDDQGWRIEIKKHPEINSREFFTQEEIKELIEYGKTKHVEIIPEIDIPGHTAALLSVFPQFGCQHKIEEKIEVGETTNRMLCASNPEVYLILEDIITELSSLFPSEFIHLGGDEAAIAENWSKCENCLSLMNELGFSEPSKLMIPFFDKIFGYVRDNGKRPILWCELNSIYPPADDYLFPYPEDVVLVTWRNGLTPFCLDLTGKSSHPLIMAPGEFAYLDYPQYKGDLPEFNNWGMPISTLSNTYKFDPGYGKEGFEPTNIKGIMGTLWGEAIKDFNRLTYMAFPRALALSESGWTEMRNRNWESFKQRLYPNLYQLMKEGISFRVPFEIVETK